MSSVKYRASPRHSPAASGIRPAFRLGRLTPSVREWALRTVSRPSPVSVRKSAYTAPLAAATPSSPANRSTSSSVKPRVESRRKS